MYGGDNVIEFETIYLKYSKDVYTFLFSLSRNEHVAEELTQETFYKAFKNINQFKGTCKMSVWLCQIAKNSFFTYYKKQKKYGYEIDAEVPDYTNFEEQLIDKEMTSNIYQQLDSLNEPYKEVFVLHLFGEMSFIEISQMSGKSESWARVTYHRAKIKIQESLKEAL